MVDKISCCLWDRYKYDHDQIKHYKIHFLFSDFKATPAREAVSPLNIRCTEFADACFSHVKVFHAVTIPDIHIDL